MGRGARTAGRGPGAPHRRWLAGALLLTSAAAGGSGPTLPAAIPDAVAEELALIDPRHDRWPLEAAAAELAERLTGVERRLASEPGLDPVALAALAHSDLAATALAPADLEEVFADRTFVVQRPASPLGAVRYHGPAGLGKALHGLVEPLGVARRLRLEVVAIAAVEGGYRTRIRYTGSGRRAAGPVQQNATWTAVWSRQGGDLRLFHLVLDRYEEVRARSDETPFVERTGAVLGADPAFRAQLLPGLDRWQQVFDRASGIGFWGDEGIAVGDVDGDGRDDLYIAQPGGLPDRLFVQQPDGTARDRAPEAALDSLEPSRGALLVDLDDDGDQDLAVVRPDHVVLLANDGQGRFVPRTLLPLAGGVALAAADYDGDGDLDLFGCASRSPEDGMPPVPYLAADNGGTNRLFQNRGDFSFAETTAAAGLADGHRRFSRAAAWEDYDDDGDADLYVADDFGGGHLYRNDDGRFTDVTAAAGVATEGGRGAAWADVDGDGRMDLYVAGHASAAGQRLTGAAAFPAPAAEALRARLTRYARGDALLLNRGDGTFREVEPTAGTAGASWGVSPLFADLDGDGREDLVVPNGGLTGAAAGDLDSFFWRRVVARSPELPIAAEALEAYVTSWATLFEAARGGVSWSGGGRHRTLLNRGDGRFSDVSAAAGLDMADDGRAAAASDWDQDGDLDLWLAERNGPRLRFVENRTDPADAFVAVRLRGTAANRDAVGARLALTLASGETLYRSLQAGGSGGQSSKWVHFGLAADGGAAASVERLVVRWPGGGEETFDGLAGGGRYLLVEGSGVAAPLPRRSRAAPGAPPPAAPPVPATTSRVVLTARLPLPPLSYLDPQGVPHTLLTGSGTTLLYLWGDRCDPCRDGLAALAAQRQASLDRQLRVLTLAVPGTAGAPPAGLAAGTPSGELLDVLAAAARLVLESRRQLPLPAAWLIDRQGRLAVLYAGGLEPSTLAADLALLPLDGEALRRRAVPFPGSWVSPPPALSRALVADELAATGHPELAARLLAAQAAPADAEDVETDELARALELDRQGDKTAALAAFQRAVDGLRRRLADDPDDTQARNNLGLALAATGQRRAALEAFEAVLAVDPEDATALFNSALLHARLGDSAAAAERTARLERFDSAGAAALRAALGIRSASE